MAEMGIGRSVLISPCDLHDQHAVPVGVEPVPLGDRMPVGLECQIGSGESAHQKKKTGPQEVKISQKKRPCARLPELAQVSERSVY